ncbi:MAG TPA: hypothetical protein VLF66_02645 [Thermoanaerobaculia bacterium]|nr:hypothetical protein [Thermoanaerobaculia bacterium]
MRPLEQNRRRIDAAYALLAVLCLAAGVLGIGALPRVQGVPENGFVLGLLLLVVGPAALVFGVLTVQALHARPLVRVLLATVGYLLGVFSFFVLAVSTGRLQP